MCSIAGGPVTVSILEIVINPGKFDGKKVIVHGYFLRGHRTTSIFLTQECGEHDLAENAIIVGTDNTVYPKGISRSEEFSGKYVELVGRFTAYKPDTVVYEGYLEVSSVNVYPPVAAKGEGSGASR